MSDPIARLLAEREALDRGLSSTLAASLGAHVALVAAAFVLPWLLPREPPLRVIDGFAVVLPRGGGGAQSARAPLDFVRRRSGDGNGTSAVKRRSMRLPDSWCGMQVIWPDCSRIWNAGST